MLSFSQESDFDSGDIRLIQTPSTGVWGRTDSGTRRRRIAKMYLMNFIVTIKLYFVLVAAE